MHMHASKHKHNQPIIMCDNTYFRECLILTFKEPPTFAHANVTLLGFNTTWEGCFGNYVFPQISLSKLAKLMEWPCLLKVIKSVFRFQACSELKIPNKTAKGQKKRLYKYFPYSLPKSQLKICASIRALKWWKNKREQKYVQKIFWFVFYVIYLISDITSMILRICKA